MQLEQAAIELRAREPWEAVDLGTVMLRAWWRPIYASLLAVVLPVTLLLHLLLASRPWLALLLTWWLKPLYDRVILHVLARAVFGAAPGVRETLAGLMGLIRSTGLLAALTWRRFDIARAFNLPVHQLEGQHGFSARTRSVVLGRRAASQASGVLYACILFELVAMLSLSAFSDLITPATLDAEYGIKAFLRYLWSPDAPTWGVYLNHALYVAALCAIEPLYVAGSFALYLNRRTTLEAWDLELSFRRMAERHRDSHSVGSGVWAIVILVVLGVALPVHDGNAAEQRPREVIRDVLAAPEFQEYRMEKIWQRRVKDEQRASSRNFRGLAEFLKFLSDVFAGLVRVAAYALLAIGAFFLIRYLVRNLGQWKFTPTARDQRAPPRVLFGLDVRPEALPENLAQVAAATADSDPRLSLSLLYRGALATLIHRDRIDFASGDTEVDCLRRVDHSGLVPLSTYFRRLVSLWSEAAYAQRVPDRSTIKTLCAEWSQHFSPRIEAS
jgi:hypothetical protein